MDQDARQQAIEGAMARRLREDEPIGHLELFNQSQTDWYGWCSKCKEKLTGTIKQIKGHTCGI